MAKILIIDDSEFAREILADTLKKFGYEVATLKNGEEIISQLKTIEPDLIMLEVELGHKLDGFDVCKIIRASENKVKIALYTGYIDKLDSSKAKIYGADDFIPKPIDERMVLLSLKRLLKNG